MARTSSSTAGGAYTREPLKTPGNRFADFDLLPFDKEHGFKVVELMRPIAAAHQASVAQVAIAWLLAKSAVSSVLVGASKLPQLEDNLAAAQPVLSPADLATLEATVLAPVHPNWFIDRLADQAVEAALRPPAAKT